MDDSRKIIMSDDFSGFVMVEDVVPGVILDIRYYSACNFIGERIDGYDEPVALLTKEAALALKNAGEEIGKRGLCFRIYDAYRPQMAVDHFVRWAKNPDDVRMKEIFYPDVSKQDLFPLGFIAEHSGHSRGSTIDLTLFDIVNEKDLDMGGTFDFFGEISRSDYKDLSPEQLNNRKLLREVMVRNGFAPLKEEWWHYTLRDEPYPNTYFSFPNNRALANKKKDAMIKPL